MNETVEIWSCKTKLSLDKGVIDPRLSAKSCFEIEHEMLSAFADLKYSITGEFANNLPDYQKIEIMVFILGKFPQFTSEEHYGYVLMGYLGKCTLICF